MNKLMKYGWLIVTIAILGACSITPSTIVQQPMSARAQAAATPAKSGAIFNQAAYRPLFEDRRPRYVGDTVTVTIAENTSARKSGGSSASKDGEVDGSIASFLGKAIPRATFSAGSSSSYDDAAAANSSNAFNGAVTATVIEVLPNGFLVVSGEKQISLDKGTEFVRFSGVVNPDTITIGNVVSSTKIADARVEYRTNSKIDAAEIASMFARFFLSISAL
jgi:flagellar L-ring protein FlgH